MIDDHMETCRLRLPSYLGKKKIFEPNARMKEFGLMPADDEWHGLRMDLGSGVGEFRLVV